MSKIKAFEIIVYKVLQKINVFIRIIAEQYKYLPENLEGYITAIKKAKNAVGVMSGIEILVTVFNFDAPSSLALS